jgi:hypothetical protein
MALSLGTMTGSFIDNFNKDKNSIAFRGKYLIQIQNYLKYFQLNTNFKIFIYDDLVDDFQTFWNSLCRYLDISETTEKYPWLVSLYEKDGLEISDQDRGYVEKFFSLPNKELSHFLGIELKWR